MRLPFERVCVVGLGYVGLPTAAILASHGVEVIGLEVNPAIVEKINRGQVHFVEPELDAVVQAVVSSGKLRAVLKPEPAEVFMIAVPTPIEHGTNAPDVSFVLAAGRAIAPVLKKGNLVILESTSPVGTTDQLAQLLAQARPDLSFPHQAGPKADVRLAYCPERILPGRVLREIVENDRIVGGMSPACAKEAKALYQIFVRQQVFTTDAKTAEMVKLTENSFRDVNIAFANELSMVCDHLGVSVWEVIELANRHPRVKILQPGPGVGGHCIAVDPWFIVASAPEQAKLMRTARLVNDSKPLWVVDKVKLRASRFREPVIACLGLAFKPDIDDLRESPAVAVVKELARQKVGRILAVEPYVSKLPQELASLEPAVTLVETGPAIQQADIVVMLVNHRYFNDIDPQELNEKILLDTRGVWR